MRLNRNIPGQMTDAELLQIMEIAKCVPEDGIIVEVGALYGLSTWHLSTACAPGVTIFSIDPWKREDWIVENVEKKQNAPRFSFDEFRTYTKDCKNVVPITGYSPEIARGWQLKIDCYFDDAVHWNPPLKQNLSFWRKFVKSGGVICGHDYTPIWPDVVKEAKAIAEREEAELKVIDKLWAVSVK